MRRKSHLLPKVLIVDDDPRNIGILTELLEEDYRLRTADSGKAGLEQIQSFRPDIVLLDIMMPGMDGLEVCKRIRQDEASRYCKILFISGKVTLEDRLAGYEAGGDDYITKPFDHDEVMAKLAVFVKLKSTQEINQIKRNFLNLMAHETHTPLNGVLGLADYIMDDDSLSREDIRNMLKEISEAGQNLMKLFRKVLLLVSLGGQYELEEVEEDFSEVVGLALDAQKLLAQNKNIQVKPEVEPCRMHYDRDLMIKTLCFILENAVHHSPEEAEIEIVGQRIGDTYRLEIVDHGQGMSTEEIEQLSQEFTVKDVRHHQQGHGLGLAIVRRITELHGGTLTIESFPGQGTSVSLQIPIR
jgi:signal transduction histidine kinase